MKRYSSDLTDGQWQFIEKILNDSRKRTHSLREIWNAILYLVKTGCQWRMLPKCFAHWAAVYYYFKKWKRDGTFEQVPDMLNDQYRKSQGKKQSPSLGIIDSQSVKASHTCSEQTGYDAGKRIKGRKRHIITDTPGCLHFVLVHAANVQDRNGIRQVLPLFKDKVLRGIKKIASRCRLQRTACYRLGETEFSVATRNCLPSRTIKVQSVTKKMDCRKNFCMDFILRKKFKRL